MRAKFSKIAVQTVWVQSWNTDKQQKMWLLVKKKWKEESLSTGEKVRKKKIAYLTNIDTAVGVSARSIPFHDFEIWNFCLAFSGRRGSVSCLTGSGSLPFSATFVPFSTDSSWTDSGLKQREHNVPISLSSLVSSEGDDSLFGCFRWAGGERKRRGRRKKEEAN